MSDPNQVIKIDGDSENDTETVPGEEALNMIEPPKTSEVPMNLPHRTISVDSKRAFACPKINCPEKIVICLDISYEMEKIVMHNRSRDKIPALKVIKRTLSMFVHSKNRLDSRHQFALMVLYDRAQWMHEFTNKPNEILEIIEDVDETHPSTVFDMGSLFEEVEKHVTIPEVENPTVMPPPYIIRVLFIYGRSLCVPTARMTESQKRLQSSPHFFFDALYIHETQTEENNCQAAFDVISAYDNKGQSYIFSISDSLTRVYDRMAMLLTHPLLRPIENEARYDIESDIGDNNQ